MPALAPDVAGHHRGINPATLGHRGLILGLKRLQFFPALFYLAEPVANAPLGPVHCLTGAECEHPEATTHGSPMGQPGEHPLGSIGTLHLTRRGQGYIADGVGPTEPCPYRGLTGHGASQLLHPFPAGGPGSCAGGSRAGLAAEACQLGHRAHRQEHAADAETYLGGSGPPRVNFSPMSGPLFVRQYKVK